MTDRIGFYGRSRVGLSRQGRGGIDKVFVLCECDGWDEIDVSSIQYLSHLSVCL